MVRKKVNGSIPLGGSVDTGAGEATSRSLRATGDAVMAV